MRDADSSYTLFTLSDIKSSTNIKLTGRILLYALDTQPQAQPKPTDANVSAEAELKSPAERSSVLPLPADWEHTEETD